MTDSTLKPAADAAKDAAAEAAQAVTTAADDAKKVAADAAKDVEKAADKAVDASKDAAKDVKAAAADATKDAGAAAKKAGAAVETTTKDLKAAAGKKADDVADALDGEKAEKPKPPERSVEEIQAELAATRERLAGRIDDLAEYVKPANLVDRQVKKVTGIFVDEYGGIKPVPVLAAAGAVIGLVLVIGLGRRRRSS